MSIAMSIGTKLDDNITTKFSPLGASQNHGHGRVFRCILTANKYPYHVYMMLGEVWCVYGGGGGCHVYHIRVKQVAVCIQPLIFAKK